MFLNSRPFYNRILCLLLACLILANCFLIPVRASALLLEVIGAVTRNLVASLIRACGVYVAEGINNTIADGYRLWDDLVDFVVARLPKEFLYINAVGTSFCKMVLKDGIYYAPRDLVTSIIEILTTPQVTDDGTYVKAVGYGFNFSDARSAELDSMIKESQSIGIDSTYFIRDFSKCYWIEFTDPVYDSICSPLIVFTNGIVEFDYYASDGGMEIIIGAGVSMYLYRDRQGNVQARYRDSGSSAFVISNTVSSASCDVYSGKKSVDLDSVATASLDSVKAPATSVSVNNTWLSNSVWVDDSRLSGVTECLPITIPSSVRLSATSSYEDIISGTKVEVDTVTVPVTGTDTDTDTDTGTDVIPDTNTGILSEILTTVKGLAVSVTQPITSSISSAITAISDFMTPKYENLGFYSLPGLKDFFPFCIPFDLYAFMCVLCAEPEAPCFTFACPLPGGKVYEVEIDLAVWNDVAAAIRYCVVAIYIVTLANVTRNRIKW